MRWRLAVRLGLLTAVFALGACGGGSKTSSSSSSGPAVPESEVNAITNANVAIFASANAERNIVGRPQNVRQAQRLLKPLTVANTLQVGPSNSVAGGLVSNLSAQLDNLVPGLTIGDADQEHLDGPVVHRFMVYGLKDPVQVFKPKAAAGVRQLNKLLHGVAGQTRVTSAGVVPAQTARQLVARDEQSVSPYWPDLLKRLQALSASFT